MSTGTELANYDEMLAQMAKAAAAVEKPVGASITVRAGVLQYAGQQVPGNKLDAIVLDSVYTNLYYEGKFDPQNISNPVCFAYSPTGEAMAPHPQSSKPQAESCDACPMNAWGSDPDGGRGKACKNVRSLALVPAGTKAEDAPNAEIAVLKLPVMSVKNWSAYVQKCAALYARPPIGVLTQIGTVPDAKAQFKITFEDKGLVDMGVFAKLFPRMGQAQELLQHAYEANPEPSAEEPKKAGKSKY